MKLVAVNAALEAGKVVMEHFHKRHRIREKSPHEFVTEADKASETLIKKMIHSKFHDHNIISEESVKENRGSEYTWFIDPIDGTHNYMRGMPYFGINIALMKNDEIILGVINLPALNILLVAEKNKGCFVNGKQVHVSNRNLRESIFLTTTHFKSDKSFMEEVKKMDDVAFSIRTIGCAAMDTFLIASGSCEIYLCHHIKPWDIAPGLLAVREAGGKVTDFKGNEGNVWMPDLIFSNGKSHQEIIRYLE